jgi:hypothetical protein
MMLRDAEKPACASFPRGLEGGEAASALRHKPENICSV